MRPHRRHVAACGWLAATLAGPVAADPPVAVETATAAAAGDPSAAPGVGTADPLERLRERIERRLSAHRATGVDVTPSPQRGGRAPAATARAAAGAARPATPASAAHPAAGGCLIQPSN